MLQLLISTEKGFSGTGCDGDLEGSVCPTPHPGREASAAHLFSPRLICTGAARYSIILLPLLWEGESLSEAGFGVSPCLQLSLS